jgi:DNA invertase Pin-like site-specific DNA recombinase
VRPTRTTDEANLRAYMRAVTPSCWILDALKVVESLKGRGVKLHLLDLGGDIAGNGISKLFLTIAAAFAEAERDRIRGRIGQAKADQKSRGRGRALWLRGWR